jgi:very-short-patch-repair endonuclease
MIRHITSYSWRLLALASEPRRPPRPAQRRLWAELKARKVGGCRFLRQHSIDRYVVDFYCRDVALAIQVDAPNRDDRAACDAERERDVRLRLCGVAVLRFTDDEVMHNLEGVLARIRQAVRYLPWRRRHE